MNLYRIGGQLRVAYFALRLGRMLGLHRLANRTRLSIAHRRIVAFWFVAGLAFTVPWGWLYYTERTGPASYAVCSGWWTGMECGWIAARTERT